MTTKNPDKAYVVCYPDYCARGSDDDYSFKNDSIHLTIESANIRKDQLIKNGKEFACVFSYPLLSL